MLNTNLDDIELRSDDIQDILTKTPSWMIRWGNTLFLVLIVLLIALCYFIRYPEIISSTAIITTEIPAQKEYAKTTGLIDSIFVKDNQIVNKNEPLAIIRNTANYNDVVFLKTIIDTISINKTSFSFPINQIPILFLGDIESSYSLFENNYLQYTLNKKMKPFDADAIADKNALSELNSRLKNLKSQKALSTKELHFKTKDLKRNKLLFNKGVISEKDYELIELEYLYFQRNIQNTEIAISQIKEAISNAQRTSKSTYISSLREETTLLKNTIQSFNLLKKSIKDWEMKYVFSSKLKGKVSFLNYWSKNQNINQGDLVFAIIPLKESSYFAKLKTYGKNLGKVKIGQTVNIKTDNYPDYEFGVLKGQIKKISKISDADGFYSIHVTLPNKLITTYKKEIEFKQDMLGSAEIVTEDLSLIQRLLYQFREVISR